MTDIVIRSRDKNAKGFLSLSDDARRRAREYLESAGIAVERLPPLIWPDDAVSAYHEHMYAPWKFTTKADIRRKKIEKMNESLQWKREDGVVRRVPLYVWVFHCPGVSGFAFKGWWTYLIGIKGECYGGGHKGNVEGGLFDKIKELFPIADPMLHGIEEGWEQDERWMKGFARRYQRGKWCGKPQGKAPVWAEIEGNSIRKILSRAEWPMTKGGENAEH